VDARSGEPDPHLVFLENVLMVGGRMPIKAGDEIVGAIGVSGAPGSVRDEECAEAGIGCTGGLRLTTARLSASPDGI
jgi:uncharacterized protein GlcG (DUF336 family)